MKAKLKGFFQKASLMLPSKKACRKFYIRCHEILRPIGDIVIVIHVWQIFMEHVAG